MQPGQEPHINVGIVGVGTIGRRVAKALDQGMVPGVQVTGLNSRDLAKAEAFSRTLFTGPKVVDLVDLPGLCDLLIEAASANAVEATVKTALESGKPVMVLSCGALLDRQDLIEMARRQKVTIHVPSGAIFGLDGLLAAAAGNIESVTMISRKPPEGLRGTPGVEKAGVDLDSLTSATVLYEGPVLEGFGLFPANINVSAAISMAGIGPLRTHIQVIADPSVTHNIHEVVVKGEFGRMELRIENIPSEENPRTGRLTALSVLAYLRQLTSPLHLGV